MPTKNRNLIEHIYFIDTDGEWHEVNSIQTVDIGYGDCSSIPVIKINGYEIDFAIKSTKTLKKLKKEHKHWINCISRHIRRRKRIKEQRRRALLKWRALHNT